MGSLIRNLWDELRYAGLSLTRERRVTCTVILSIMLGIGANTALFSVVYAVLLRPLPFWQPDRLVFIAEHGITDSIGLVDFLSWRRELRSFESIGAFAATDQTLTADGTAVPARVLMFSETIGEIFGARPAFGRDFAPEEVNIQPGGPPGRLALISHSLFLQRFGGKPESLGRTLTINNTAVTIIGVLPANFRFEPQSILGITRETDIIVNMPFGSAGLRGHGPLVQVVGRLRPTVSLETARAEVETVRAELARDFPGEARRELRLMPLHERLVGSARMPIMALWAATTCVLLIACANVTNILLTRALSRTGLSAVRAALGASRARMILHTVMESLLLGFGGGLAGLIFAFAFVRFIVAIAPVELPRLKDTTINGYVLVFCLILSVLSTVAAGIVPAWRESLTDPGSALKLYRVAGGNRRSRRLMGLMVVVEVSLTLVLLTGTGLMLKSIWLIRSEISAIRPELVVTASVNSRQLGNKVDQTAYYDELVGRLEAIPGVEFASVAGCGAVPLRIVGLPPPPPSVQQINLWTPCVSLHHRQTARLRLISGRWLEPTDGQEFPAVAVLNEAAVRAYKKLYPLNDSPLGRRLDVGGPVASSPTIVGVVSDFKTKPTIDAEPMAYVPLAQSPIQGLGVVLVRTTSNPEPIMDSIRKLAVSSRGVTITRPRTLESELFAAIGSRQLQTMVLVAFSIVALLLSLVGVYGCLSYGVAQRTQEIGLRLALGANRQSILTLILMDGLKLVFAGVVLGIAGTVLFTRFIGSLLYGVEPFDLASFCLVSLLVVGGGIAAAYIPARSAVRVDPSLALRRDC